MDKAFEKLSQESQTIFAKLYQSAQGDNAGGDGDTTFHQGPGDDANGAN